MSDAITFLFIAIAFDVRVKKNLVLIKFCHSKLSFDILFEVLGDPVTKKCP